MRVRGFWEMYLGVGKGVICNELGIFLATQTMELTHKKRSMGTVGGFHH